MPDQFGRALIRPITGLIAGVCSISFEAHSIAILPLAAVSVKWPCGRLGSRGQTRVGIVCFAWLVGSIRGIGRFITSPYGAVLLLLGERICLALITDVFLPADQARPLPVSISTLIRNRPQDSNSEAVNYDFWFLADNHRVGSIPSVSDTPVSPVYDR